MPSYSANFIIGDREQFVNKICRIMDFNEQVKSALILNPDSTEMVMVDLGCDCKYFLCELFRGFPIPVGLNPVRKMQLISLCMDGDPSVLNMRQSLIMSMSLKNGAIKEEYFEMAASIKNEAMDALINFAQNFQMK